MIDLLLLVSCFGLVIALGVWVEAMVNHGK